MKVPTLFTVCATCAACTYIIGILFYFGFQFIKRFFNWFFGDEYKVLHYLLGKIKN